MGGLKAALFWLFLFVDLQIIQEKLMPFTSSERDILLTVKGVGPTVVKRLEEMGFDTLDQLSNANMLDVVAHGAAMLGSSCWKNSPQARSAIDGAINAARIATSK
jgi:predicted RecB family nuclease